jgi:CheY-like chemotaxis protein
MLAYSGRGRFFVEPVDLNQLVTEMLHLLKVSMSKNAIPKFNFGANLPAVEADATQIRQVIMNLITNASEALGDKSGFISISTGAVHCDETYFAQTHLPEQLPQGFYVYIEVSDTGCGMNKETISRIFDPFFTTKFTGRGLGLAAALGIVRGHKGAMKVYSEPGRGSTFKVLFPASEQPAASLPKEDPLLKSWRGQGTILLVDDEETVRSVTQRILEKLGFTVLTAADGREALDVFSKRAKEIVCVLLDLTMPHMGGEETYRELRRIKSDVRVILASGYDEQDVSDRFGSKGLAGFLHKPFQIVELISKLQQALAK